MSDDYVLVVEDDPMHRRILTGVLEDEGFHTQAARDGIEALELCERQLPALMITDLNMPRLDGAALVEQLESRGLGNFPIIVVSGRHDLMESASRFASHAQFKPLDLDRLMRRVHMLLPYRQIDPEANGSKP